MPLQASSPRSAADDRSRATAKWGAACSSCASAKAKCIRTNEDHDSKCDRCKRLLKACTGQVHKPRKKRANKPSKTAQLEERLNGLVDLLRATGELPVLDDQETVSPCNPPSVPSLTRDGLSMPSSGPSPGHDTEPRRDSITSGSAPVATAHTSNIIQSRPPTIPSTYNSFAPPSCICRPEAGETATDAVESDEALLDKFRKGVHPMLPIVILPTYNGAPATAAQLSADRPFLFLAIKTVASVDNYKSMQGLMYRLVNHVADYMLLRAERSLDLLHGLLTILSWYHHHCMIHAQLGNLLHLATSLVCDLNLNRPPRIAERTDLMVLHPNIPSPRTNDERRVLLGLWYLRSSVAHCFQKTEPMRYTPYIRQCVQELEDAHEIESDDVLVAVIKMQHLAERVIALNSRDEGIDDLPGYPRAPKSAYRIAFQGELDVLTDSFTKAMKAHHLIQSHVAALKIRLYEPPLLDLALLKKLSGSLASVASPTMSTALDTLYAARNAIRDFFDLFFDIPITLFPWLPLPLYAHIVHAITMLSRWARLMGPVRLPQAKYKSSSDARSRAPSVSSAPHLSTAKSGGSKIKTGTSGASLDLRDPSHRLVPGQGAGASAHGVSNLTVMPGVDSRDLQRDPSLHSAIARMREHLRQQPDLMFDIPDMLATIWDRFEQSNHHMRKCGAAKFGDSVGRGMNAWDLTARKIAIMRFKIGRYLDGSSSTIGDSCGSGGSGGSGITSAGTGDQCPGQRQEQPPANADSHSSDNDNPPTYTHQATEAPAHPQPVPMYNQQELSYAHQQPAHHYAYAPALPPQNQHHHRHQQQQQQQQQQLPIHNHNHNLDLSGPSPGMGAGIPAASIPPPLSGLPPDLGNYVMSGVGVGVADLSYGLGNLEGWESDPLWGAEVLANSDVDPNIWGDSMDWVSSAMR